MTPKEAFQQNVLWYSVFISVGASLTIGSYVLGQHIKFPHSGASNQEDIRQIREDIKELKGYMYKDIDDLKGDVNKVIDGLQKEIHLLRVQILQISSIKIEPHSEMVPR